MIQKISWQYKLCKVKKVGTGRKGVPFLVTHDARTIRYPNPDIKVHDTVMVDIATGKITQFIKFEPGEWLIVNFVVLQKYLSRFFSRAFLTFIFYAHVSERKTMVDQFIFDKFLHILKRIHKHLRKHLFNFVYESL